MRLNRLIPVIIVLAVFLAIGIVAGLTANWFPDQASAEAVSVDSLFNFMLAIAVFIFLIVEVGIVYTIIRFRARKGDDSDGRNYHGNTALEITWTAIPAVIVFVLAILSFQVFADLRTPGENAVVIGAHGQQFQWSFQYPLPPRGETELVGDPEKRDKVLSYMVDTALYVPLNRPVTMDITAADVMHAFYVPEFRVKQDAIPGRVTNTYFTPTKLGVYSVECAELCGSGHGNMSLISKVHIVEQADFDAYIEGLYDKAIAIVNDPRNAEVGKVLLASGRYPCSGCHILTDAYPLQNKIGPSLNGIATRAAEHAANGEGVLGGNDAAAYIRTSIINPNFYVVAGYPAGVMPQNFGDRSIMPEDDLEAIVNYLLTQQ